MSRHSGSIWQTLGLDPDTATVRDVQKAYARLLKDNRPEDDASAFQAVNHAYVTAKRILAGRSSEPAKSPPATPVLIEPATPVAEPVLPNSPKPVSATKPAYSETGDREYRSLPRFEDTIPASVQGALHDLRIALRKGNEDAVATQTDRLLQESRRYPEAIWAMDELLQSGLERFPKAVSRSIEVSDAVRFLEYGCGKMVSHWIEHLDREDELPALRELGVAIGKARSRMLNPEAAQSIMLLAGKVAILAFHLGESLFGVAYPNFPISSRANEVNRYERLATIGRAIRLMEAERRYRWRSLIAKGEKGTDWTTRANRRFLTLTGKSLENNASILKTYLPPEAWAVLDKANARSVFRVAPKHVKRAESDTSMSGCSIAILVFLAIKVISLLTVFNGK